MRLLLALTALLLAFNLFVPERDASTLLADYLQLRSGEAAAALSESGFAVRPDQTSIAVMQPHQVSDESPEVESVEQPPSDDPIDPVLAPEPVPEVSLGDL